MLKRMNIFKYISIFLIFINLIISAVVIFYDNYILYDFWFRNTGMFIRFFIISLSEIYLFFVYEKRIFNDSITLISMFLGLIYIIFCVFIIVSIGTFKF